MNALLFPLPGLILNPMSKLTLNIFEPRYLEMIERSVSEGIPLAVAPSYPQVSGSSFVKIEHESTPYVYPYCGHGAVQLLGETTQGTKIIMVEGAGKARIVQVNFKGQFNEVVMESVAQESILDESNIFIYRRIRSLTRETLLEKLKREDEVQAIMAHLDDPQSLVAFYSDHILNDFEKRLRVFAANSLSEKLQLLGKFRVHH